MRRRLSSLLTPLFVGSLAAANVMCGDPVPPTDAPLASACTPAQQVKCGCIDGKDGVQTCKGDGSGYEPCDCSGKTVFDAGSTGPCPADMVFVEADLVGLSAPDLCVDRTEVTVGAFRACVTAGRCGTPSTTESSGHRSFTRASACNWGVSGRDGHPVNCVDANDAETYCAFLGKRLPTDDELAWAASGPLGTTYPWGDTPPDDTRACWKQTHTCEATAHPAGATFDGILDLAGNVWERTSTSGSQQDSMRARGGGFYETSADRLRSSTAGDCWPEERLNDLGFRCVKDP